tara:strand:+ start:270 stop:455 length:186 start_codon:yes stop_codon:yes gene_type:complete
MSQKFKDISVGTVFKYEDKTLVKINDIRVTCCKVFNATLVDDANQKHFVVPIHEVEVVNND